MNFESRTILLVEDNEDDVFIFNRAYRQTQLPHPVQIATDGKEALDYLLGEGPYADREKHPLPFLVFLDLKLPFKSGHEVLQTIRSVPALTDVNVVVLTSSAESRDILRANEHGAQGFLVKPPAAATLAAAIIATRARIETPESPAPKIPGDMLSTISAASR